MFIVFPSKVNPCLQFSTFLFFELRETMQNPILVHLMPHSYFKKQVTTHTQLYKITKSNQMQVTQNKVTINK